MCSKMYLLACVRAALCMFVCLCVCVFCVCVYFVYVCACACIHIAPYSLRTCLCAIQLGYLFAIRTRTNHIN